GGGPAPSPATAAEGGGAPQLEVIENEPEFAAHAAAFHEAPITPELNALEIVALDGIREKKVKEIALEVPYKRMDETAVKRIREIFEDHAGEIPVSVTITEVPENLGKSEVRLRL